MSQKRIAAKESKGSRVQADENTDDEAVLTDEDELELE